MNLITLTLVLSCIHNSWSVKGKGGKKDYTDGAEAICEQSETVGSMPGFVCKGQLIFEDDFNYLTIKQGKVWTPEIMFPGAPDYPFNVFLIGEHMRLNTGSLTIKPAKLDSVYGEGFIHRKMELPECTGQLGTDECVREGIGPLILPPIVTAKVTTKRTFSFKYGRVEVKAKMPKGNWLVPEIQLEPLLNKYGSSNHSSGILRVAFVKGNIEYSRKLYGGPIMCASQPLRTKYLRELTGSRRWSEDYHIYSLEWRPDSIRLFVDGQQYGEVKPATTFADDISPGLVAAAKRWKKGDALAPFDDMFYLSVGMTVGGVNEFPDDELKPWSNSKAKAMLSFWNSRHEWFPSWMEDSELRVDYVKVFAL